MTKSSRAVQKIISGFQVSDGDGVQLTRLIGTSALEMLDPFLLFDAFGSNEPEDYIGGFPSHPHRGFETVTYMLEGKMRHEDSVGNSGTITAGGVQWMTAGSGVIHAEMPEQDQGRLAGLQLWVNLPASHKMIAPKYQQKTVYEIPLEILPSGGSIKVVAGITSSGTEGVIQNQHIHPVYWDVHLRENEPFYEKIARQHNAFIYLIHGVIEIGSAQKVLSGAQLAVLTQGEEIFIKARQRSRFLLIAGKPLNEPVARAGPFVMNSKEQLRQAFSDYQSGQFG